MYIPAKLQNLATFMRATPPVSTIPIPPSKDRSAPYYREVGKPCREPSASLPRKKTRKTRNPTSTAGFVNPYAPLDQDQHESSDLPRPLSSNSSSSSSSSSSNSDADTLSSRTLSLESFESETSDTSVTSHEDTPVLVRSINIPAEVVLKSILLNGTENPYADNTKHRGDGDTLLDSDPFRRRASFCKLSTLLEGDATDSTGTCADVDYTNVLQFEGWENLGPTEYEMVLESLDALETLYPIPPPPGIGNASAGEEDSVSDRGGVKRLPAMARYRAKCRSRAIQARARARAEEVEVERERELELELDQGQEQEPDPPSLLRPSILGGLGMSSPLRQCWTLEDLAEEECQCEGVAEALNPEVEEELDVFYLDEEDDVLEDLTELKCFFKKTSRGS